LGLADIVVAGGTEAVIHPMPIASFAAMQALEQQIGGTYDDPSSINLPEMSLTIGQAYINIRGALSALREEYDMLLTKYIKIYPG
jgi:3-oxoacyl-[acyl-carrier-protein] synthase II